MLGWLQNNWFDVKTHNLEIVLAGDMVTLYNSLLLHWLLRGNEMSKTFTGAKDLIFSSIRIYKHL